MCNQQWAGGEAWLQRAMENLQIWLIIIDGRGKYLVLFYLYIFNILCLKKYSLIWKCKCISGNPLNKCGKDFLSLSSGLDLKQKPVGKRLCNPLTNLAPHKNLALLNRWRSVLVAGVVSHCFLSYLFRRWFGSHKTRRAVGRASCSALCSTTNVVACPSCHFWPCVVRVVALFPPFHHFSVPNVSPCPQQRNLLCFSDTELWIQPLAPGYP